MRRTNAQELENKSFKLQVLQDLSEWRNEYGPKLSSCVHLLELSATQKGDVGGPWAGRRRVHALNGRSQEQGRRGCSNVKASVCRAVCHCVREGSVC